VGPRAGLDAVEKRKILSLPGIERRLYSLKSSVFWDGTPKSPLKYSVVFMTTPVGEPEPFTHSCS
jgi:hypothetical protein